jgi:hypothetical protein
MLAGIVDTHHDDNLMFKCLGRQRAGNQFASNPSSAPEAIKRLYFRRSSWSGGGGQGSTEEAAVRQHEGSAKAMAHWVTLPAKYFGLCVLKCEAR